MLSSETWAEPDCHTRIFKEVVQRYCPSLFPVARSESPLERKRPHSFDRLERLGRNRKRVTVFQSAL